jgi:hypothetical protein
LSTAGEVSACRRFSIFPSRARQNVYPDSASVSLAEEIVALLSYDEAKNDPSYLQAMEDEIASFKRFDCYKDLSSDMVSANANNISTPWVISKKMNHDGIWRSKARLVARGYEDKEKNRVSSDSQVASSANQRLVLELLAEKQWIPNSWDFTTAFLQGKSLTRDILSCHRLTLSAAMWFGV